MGTLQRAMAELCRQKQDLLAQVSATAERYANALAEARERMGKVMRVEYERLSRAVDETRAAYELARTSLAQHLQVHGC